MNVPRPANYVVMQRRFEQNDKIGLFPTPPWATRALLEILEDRYGPLAEKSVLEPAAGFGHMLEPLERHFGKVTAADAYDHGFGFPVRDYLEGEQEPVDWVITNPPFPLAEAFAVQGMRHARSGVALLVRTSFLEGQKRHQRLFAFTPPALVAQFVERVPMLKGRLDPKASSATSYAWLVWKSGRPTTGTDLVWIPPCRKRLERADDYA